MNGNTHLAHECPYCWRVLYSQGALTRHLNDEHWKEIEQLQQDLILGIEEPSDEHA